VELLAAGREADVFLLDNRTVLRRCRDERARCEPAAELMEGVRLRGYPAPRVHRVAGAEMVLDRVTGPTMLDSLAAGTTTAAAAGHMLAALHQRLHGLPPPPGTDPGLAVRHLDLHPGNIILASSGPIVIDWRNGDVGAPGVDVALSALILAEVVCGDGPYAGPAGAVLDAHLEGSVQSVDADVEAALAYRAEDPHLSPAERALLPIAARRVVRCSGNESSR